MQMAREKIIEEVLREVVGPDPVKPSIQDNGEEILNIKPTKSDKIFLITIFISIYYSL